ncbi:MAG TPA: hypothetical protein VFV94_01985 [Polyangiaceae bacterium]|jgi:hypothetical protein|nr:hypothetical protein [Polyangiaceae bacterium]
MRTSLTSRKSVILAVAAAALAGAAAGGFALVRAPEHAARTTPNPAMTVSLPHFGRAEEAERYRRAMVDGDTRALRILDEAITAARQRAGTDRGYQESLERMRAERVARLAAYQQR